MSDVKHQPATPLPWRAAEAREVGGNSEFAAMILCDEDGGSIGEMSLGFLVDRKRANEVGAQNAEYTLHAANAYPKLVERMKQRAAFLRLIAGRIPPPLQQMIQEALYSEVASDDALLRDLGESS